MPLNDRQFKVSLTVILAWLLWAKVVIDLTLSALLENEEFAFWGLATSAAAATVHIRSFLCGFACRLHEAFDYGVEAGRDAERAAQESRELRSV